MKPLLVALLMGLAMAPPPRVSPAAGHDASASPAAGRPSPLPLRAEHRYRMLARVRPILFWITRDNVGGARVSWRGAGESESGLELLIGSDPERAPRRVNRWGYIAEEVRGTDARVIGVMKESNEQSIKDAESSVSSDGRPGEQGFQVIQSMSTPAESSARVTTVRAPGSPTYRDVDSLLTSAFAAPATGDQAKVALPPGTRPGFLTALSELIQQDITSSGHGATEMRRGTSVSYVHFRTLYDMTVRSSDRLANATLDGKRYTNLARTAFEVRNRNSGEVTRFKVTYAIDGALAGIPIHAVYQPRWWFEVQLFLDDAARF